MADIGARVAAIRAGGQYRCVPDRTTVWIALWVAIGGAFGSFTAIGLTYKPAPEGFALFALITVGPALATAGTLLVRKNSGFYLTESSLTRRDWLGRVAATYPRTEVRGVSLVPDDLGVGWAVFEVVHPEPYPVRGLKAIYLPERLTYASRRSELDAWLVWWSRENFNDFRAMFNALKGPGAQDR